MTDPTPARLSEMIAHALETPPPVPAVSPLEEVWVAFYGLWEVNRDTALAPHISGLEQALLALEESLS